jgi:C_GCAxxG_C_C family probable redox protein
MNKAQKAVHTFKNGFNCSQSVLSAFSMDYGLDDALALKISCGFGAGMGRLQETCGAVTGAYMVIGLKFGKSKKNEDNLKEKTYSLVKKFSEEFEKINKSTNCCKLLNCNLNSDEGRNIFKTMNLSKNICEKCVNDAVIILEKILNEKNE